MLVWPCLRIGQPNLTKYLRESVWRCVTVYLKIFKEKREEGSQCDRVTFTVNILAFLRLKINLFSIVLLFSYKKLP